MGLSDLDRLIEPSRVRNYALMLLAGYLLLIVVLALAAEGGLDPAGKPLGADFIAFYSAADLALQGRAAEAYDFAALFAAHERAVPGTQHLFAWYYPPPFQLIVAPLARLPYLAALGLWVGVGLGLFLALVRRLTDHPWAPLLALAFPATLLNVLHGQNGFLNAALLGFGLLLLDRRPWVAGALLGLLVYKPHLGVLLPLLLAAQGRWRSFAAAAASALGLCAASWAMLGPEVWAAFLDNFGKLGAVIDGKLLPQAKIPTLFVAARELGAPSGLAYALHGGLALALAGLTVLAWRRPGPQRLKVALAVPAILSVSPYAFDYDLVLLAIPIALLAEHARRDELPAGAKAALVLAYFTPVAFSGLAQLTHVQLMPLGVLALYAAAWASLRRAAAAQAPLRSGNRVEQAPA
ncbi:glycosyltransferase family 87 protein [Phenylobacterium terrae]|uniref:Glycosyltransferase family 87 protein n=1 Tax=Phenylobacterium terrae TaxID=2665495 RepID=A0ABW4MWU9_9CAUL